jgi:hypothetical protein
VPGGAVWANLTMADGSCFNPSVPAYMTTGTPTSPLAFAQSLSRGRGGISSIAAQLGMTCAPLLLTPQASSCPMNVSLMATAAAALRAIRRSQRAASQPDRKSTWPPPQYAPEPANIVFTVFTTISMSATIDQFST